MQFYDGNIFLWKRQNINPIVSDWFTSEYKHVGGALKHLKLYYSIR